MASLKEEVNAAFQRITNNPYAYVSNPEVVALIEALSTVAAPAAPEVKTEDPKTDVVS